MMPGDAHVYSAAATPAVIEYSKVDIARQDYGQQRVPKLAVIVG